MKPEEFIKQYFQWSGKNPEELIIPRNEYLSKAGQIEKYLYLVTEGAVRAIYISKEEEFTVRFGYKGSVIASLDSFLTGKPSQLHLQTIRKTKVIRLERSSYLSFIKSSPEVSEVHVTLISNLLNSMLDREIDLLTSSPLERFERIMERSPAVFQEIPLKYIASYLRMTPETLSRLRKQQTTK